MSKRVIIPLAASRPISALAARVFNPGIPIFMLHRIMPDRHKGTAHTPSYLRRCLRFLKKRGHNFISLDDVVATLRGKCALPPKPVVFTMDDGFYDQATLAAPVFIEFNCPATLFLISGMLDGELWPWDNQVQYILDKSTEKKITAPYKNHHRTWDISSASGRAEALHAILEDMKNSRGNQIQEMLDRLAAAVHVCVPTTPPDRYRPMTWDLARDLESKGIRFAPHTRTHRILSQLTQRESEAEISHSWARLNDELTSPSPIFCYPTGRASDFDNRETDFLRASGFLGAVSTEPAHVELRPNSDDYAYRLPRFGLPFNFIDFIQYAGWIEYAKSRIPRFQPQD